MPRRCPSSCYGIGRVRKHAYLGGILHCQCDHRFLLSDALHAGHSVSPTDSASIVAAFRQGLKEEGYVEGQNVAIESRFAEGKLGIVASLARPGDNITGVSFLLSDLAEKEVELLHELVPKAAVIGFLVDPNDPVTESDTQSASCGECLGAQTRHRESKQRKRNRPGL
jgi:hypothetical protein